MQYISQYKLKGQAGVFGRMLAAQALHLIVVEGGDYHLHLQLFK
jgi:hypothetical protein